VGIDVGFENADELLETVAVEASFQSDNNIFPQRTCLMRASVIVCKGTATRARFRDKSRTRETGCRLFRL
jgi:hypothetical protein